MEDNHLNFKLFAKNLESTLEKYEKNTGQDLLREQRKQIKQLISLENDFRKALIAHKNGQQAYIKFIEFICDKKKNILAARPYFRERQTVFTKSISGALKKRNHKTLFKYRINYSFVVFVLSAFHWSENSQVVKLAKQIEGIRQQITEQNLPLAISQARIFYGSTPKSHVSWMDLVQIHCGGLLIAVDKFVPESGKMTDEQSLQSYRKFRAVAIGRMISDRIENYSETLIHFYPADKKKIYRANKILKSFGENVDYAKLADAVNHGIEQDSQKTTPEEIANLLASAGTVSGDTIVGDSTETTLERYSVSDEDRFDSGVESNDAIDKMRLALRDQPMIIQKIFRLRGVDF